MTEKDSERDKHQEWYDNTLVRGALLIHLKSIYMHPGKTYCCLKFEAI